MIQNNASLNYDVIERVIKNQSQPQQYLQSFDFITSQQNRRNLDRQHIIEKVNSLSIYIFKQVRYFSTRRNLQLFSIVLTSLNQSHQIDHLINNQSKQEEQQLPSSPYFPFLERINHSNPSILSIFSSIQIKHKQLSCQLHYTIIKQIIFNNFNYLKKKNIQKNSISDMFITPFQQRNNPNIFLQSQAISPFGSFWPGLHTQSFDPHGFFNQRIEPNVHNSYDLHSIPVISSMDESNWVKFQIPKNKPKENQDQDQQLKNQTRQQQQQERQEKSRLQKCKEKQQQEVEKVEKIEKVEQVVKYEKKIKEEQKPLDDKSSNYKKLKTKKKIVKLLKDESDSWSIKQMKKIKKYGKKGNKDNQKLNDTKNITKNFSKAIISYILQNKDLALLTLNNDLEVYDEFSHFLKEIKNDMTNIKKLRELWQGDTGDDKKNKFNNSFRIVRYILQNKLF